MSVYKAQNLLRDVVIDYELGPVMYADVKKENIRLKDGTCRLTERMDKPGYYRCKVRAHSEGRTYEGLATVAFAPEKIEAAAQMPTDFKAYWERNISQARQTPLDSRMRLLPERCTDKVNVYEVSFQNEQYGSRIYGILCMPKAEGQYPALLRVPGAGVRPYSGDTYTASKGAITLEIGIHGIPVTMSQDVYDRLADWLKEGLNWDGMIVTDWADINNLCVRDHIAATKKDAIRIAINAGIDMSMVPYEVSFCDDLKELVNEGKVSMSRIDDAVRRILRLKYRLNLFNRPDTRPADYPDFGCKKWADEARTFATESQVLLKNDDNTLPLREGTRILLTGPNANSMRCLNGGWSYSWQGDKADECAVQYNTIYEAMCNRFGSDNVKLVEGVSYKKGGKIDEMGTTDIEAAVNAASDADVIVACIGETSYAETPGNISDLWLPDAQRSLVKALAATGKPVVLILNEGRPRIISDIVPLAKAVIDIMLPGNYGGDALASLIAGDSNFSAKLPFTYPSHPNSLTTYDHKPCENMGQMDGNYNYEAVIDVQWPFGAGMSYTTFAYDNLCADKTDFGADDTLTFSIDITNTGDRDGKGPVLLYSSDVVASLSPDNRRLRQFDKVELKAGERRTVKMSIKASDLAFVGADGRWTLEEGDFVMTCGSQKLTIHCNETKTWDTPNI